VSDLRLHGIDAECREVLDLVAHAVAFLLVMTTDLWFPPARVR